uniref:Transcriptional regulator n=1 Tax=Strongyloides papillosus TaxID=174720 RepID=A0A0N5BEK7_STREA
ISNGHDFHCLNGNNMCTLSFALNDPTIESVLLRVLAPMEALEIEFDAYEARRNLQTLQRLNLKLQKFVSQPEYVGF